MDQNTRTKELDCVVYAYTTITTMKLTKSKVQTLVKTSPNKQLALN